MSAPAKIFRRMAGVLMVAALVDSPATVAYSQGCFEHFSLLADTVYPGTAVDLVSGDGNSVVLAAQSIYSVHHFSKSTGRRPL